MIRKLLFISLLCLRLSATTPAHHDAQRLAKQIFGTTGVNLSLVSFQFVEDLLYRIATSTPYQQRCACKKAATVLTQEIEKRETSLAAVDTETKQHIEHNLAILTIQKDHYERVARLLKKEITIIQKIIGWIKNASARCIAFVLSPFKKYTTPIQKLTNDLVMYTEIERNEILTDHKKTLRLLVCQNKYNVPLIIRFWDYPRHRHRLLNGVKKFQSSALPQALEVISEAALEAGQQIAAETAEAGAAGVVGGVVAEAGEESLDAALEATAKSFEDALQRLIEETTESLTAEADAASPEVAQAVTEGLETSAPTAAGLPGVESSEEAIAEAGEYIDIDNDFGIPGEGMENAEQTGENAASTNVTETGDQRINTFKEEGGAEEEVATNTSKKLTKAEKAAAKAAKKAAEKAAKVAAKETAKVAKAAEKVAQQAERAAQQAANNVSKAEGNLAKARATWRINGDSNAVKEASQELDTAKETAAITRKTADEAKEAADEAKEAAETARVAAGIKTWTEKGTEFAKSIVDLVLQMEVSMGAQMVAAWQSAADALVFASLSQQRTMLMTKLNQFFSQLAFQQTNILAKINANFSAQIAVIASQLCFQTTSSGAVVMSGLLPSLFAVEQSFVTQALVTATVKSIFILNPMPDDQLFYESPMAAQQLIFSHTPFTSNGLSNSWYNPYRSGNWQFCSSDYSGTMQNPVTSFVQYGAQPFASTTYPQGDPTLAVQNSIFTEHIPPAQYNTQSVESYTISVAVTLLSEPYEPFMMGILFNGARWISGVLDLHHQHRLFCIYSLPGQKPGTYNVGFAETFYQNQGQMNQTQDQLSDQNIAGLNAIWPAYQILSPNIDALAAMAKSNAAHPITNPIATIPALPLGSPYIFTIETQPNQVTLTISTSDGKILYPAGETASSLKTELSLPNQIQNLNGLTFLYHNIGFTAPGCSAQFCIKKPTALCFSESQIKTIQASLDKGTS